MADLDLSGRVLGEFMLLERLDEGGFGAVYRCEQRLLGREAVVKVLHQRMRRHDVALQRFGREARLASRLDHPYAAHVYAFGIEPDGLLWIAMELVQGVTLSRWLHERGPLPLDQLVPFFDRVAEVVQAAHERGIVHRDLKPSNVMVIERAGRLLPKLLDFGVAKLLDEIGLPPPTWSDNALAAEEEPEPADPERTAAMRKPGTAPSPRRQGPHRLTRASAVIGSPPYMAPEQWTDPMAVGPTSDLYALGVIAYEALTGSRPFRAETSDEYSELHQNAPVPPLGASFSSALDKIFQRALAKRPEDRFGSALELAAALRAESEARLLAQIRSSARQWHDRGRPSSLLWRDDVLADLERWIERTGAGALGALEISFVDASREFAAEQTEAGRRRAAWIRRGAGAIAIAAAVMVVGVFQYRARLETRMAQKIAAATATEAEIEQGRAALLHDDMPEAQRHLIEAYRRGDSSPATAFMLRRALQPLRAEQARFSASSGRMWSAAWSSNAERIVTSDDRAAQIWDVAKRQLVATLPHGDTVYDARFTADGTQVVTAGGDGVVRIWAASDGAPVRELTLKRRDGKAARYYLAASSPDGQHIAATDTTGEIVHVWSAITGAPIAELSGAGLGWPSLAFSFDGRWLAAGDGGHVRVYDARTWALAVTLPEAPIRALTWDPVAERLLTGSSDGDVSIWAIPEGTRLRHLRDVGDAIDAMAWSRNGRLAGVAARDGTEQVFDVETGKLVSQSNQLRDKITVIEFDTESRLLLAAGTTGAVALNDAANGLPIAVLAGPAGPIRAAHFDPAGRRVVGASWDGTARVWDARAPYLRWSAPPIADGCGIATSLVPDQRFVAIGCRDHATRIWDTGRDALLAELPPVTAPSGDFSVPLPAVSASGKRAAIARGDAVDVYELPGGRLLRSIEHGAAVSAVAFGPEEAVVSGAIDGSVFVTRAAAAPDPLPPAPRGIDAVALLADDRVLAADERGQVRAIDKGRVVAEFATPTRIGQLRPSPDGTLLVTVPAAAVTGPPMLWDVNTGHLVAALEGHVGRVFAARWVAGTRLLTMGGDGTARMWDSTGALLVTYHGGSRFLADAVLSPDGSLVVGGGGDGQLRFWDAKTGRPLWTTPAHKSALIGVHYEDDSVITRGFDGDLSRWHIQ